jgi:hypothetical protein
MQSGGRAISVPPLSRLLCSSLLGALLATNPSSERSHNRFVIEKRIFIPSCDSPELVGRILFYISKSFIDRPLLFKNPASARYR